MSAHFKDNVSYAMYVCFKNNVKVYPIIKDNKHFIEVNWNGKKTTYSKQPENVNEAIKKTYLELAKKL